MAQSDEALDALREVWLGQGQTLAELDEVCGITNQKVCRNAVHMTYEGYAQEGEDARDAWKELLDREGKRTRGSSLGDLVLGAADVPENAR